MSASSLGLHEMLLTYSRAFGMACADLELVRGVIGGLVHAGGAPATITLEDEWGERLQKALQQLRGICTEIPTLDRLIPPIDRLEGDLEVQGGLAPAIMATRIQALQHSLFDELSRHWYYHVEERLIPYYSTQLPFGEQVFEAFPSATDDIIEAGRCIAVGQGTAAVFHTMLVMELGLTALGKALRIPYAPSWESYLSQIQKKIAAKHGSKTAAWKRDEAFYRDVAGDLQMIKIAWRNPTMHIVRGRTYSVEDAENIYKAARTLMQRLATRLKEPSRPRASAAGMLAPPDEAEG